MSGKAARLQMISAAQEAEQARADAAVYQAEQRRIQEQAVALQAQQIEFQRQQGEYIKQQDARNLELASRPPPPPPAPTPVIAVGGTVGAAEDQGAVDSRKRGRAALRIDLNQPQTAGATGLNVPRG